MAFSDGRRLQASLEAMPFNSAHPMAWPPTARARRCKSWNRCPRPSRTGSSITGPGRPIPAIIGPTADPDGDGIDNLLEYALAADPTIADDSVLPEIGIETVDGRRYLTLTYVGAPTTPLSITRSWLRTISLRLCPVGQSKARPCRSARTACLRHRAGEGAGQCDDRRGPVVASCGCASPNRRTDEDADSPSFSVCFSWSPGRGLRAQTVAATSAGGLLETDGPWRQRQHAFSAACQTVRAVGAGGDRGPEHHHVGGGRCRRWRLCTRLRRKLCMRNSFPAPCRDSATG